jgi:hypothetical protein
MIVFCVLSIAYVVQRSYFGVVNTRFDSVMRRAINTVLVIVWIKIVVYKGYLSYKVLSAL